MKVGEIRAQLGEARHARLVELAGLLEVSEQEVLRRLIDVGMPELRRQIAGSAAPQLPADRPLIAGRSPADRRQIAGRSPSEGTIGESSLSSSGEGDLLGGGEEHQKKTRKAKTGPPPPDFLEFWAEYPRKVDRGHALKAWQRAAREGVLPPLAEILAALRRQTLSAGWQDEVYIPYPASWINGERWADVVAEPAPPAKPARASPSVAWGPPGTVWTRHGYLTPEQVKEL